MYETEFKILMTSSQANSVRVWAVLGYTFYDLKWRGNSKNLKVL